MGSDFYIVGAGLLILVAGFLVMAVVVAWIRRGRGRPILPASPASPELGQSFRGLFARADDKAFTKMEDDFAANRAERLRTELIADLTGGAAPNAPTPATK